MKNRALALIALVFLVIPRSVVADCDWSRDIKPGQDGNYIYTRDCHLRVGDTVQDNKRKDQQIQDFSKAFDLKDLALKKSDERVDLWMNTSFKLEDKINKIDQLRSTNEWLYFGLGIVTTIGTGFMVSKLIR